MAKSRGSKHDRITDDLELRLRASGKYALVIANLEYKIDGRHGECDLFGIRRDYDAAFMFEVKTTDSSKSRHKAYIQLKKDRDYLWEHYAPSTIYGFYVYGMGSKNNRLAYELRRMIGPR